MISIKEMLSELIGRGWSQSSLARSLNTTQPTIHRLVEKGHDPSYELGKRIEYLYESEKLKAA